MPEFTGVQESGEETTVVQEAGETAVGEPRAEEKVPGVIGSRRACGQFEEGEHGEVVGGGEGYQRGFRQEAGQLGEGADGGVVGQQVETREAIQTIPRPSAVHIKPQQVASGLNPAAKVPPNGHSKQLPSRVNAKSRYDLCIAE
jgi:hypothetical protein